MAIQQEEEEVEVLVERIHVAMLPYLAFGHMLPFFNLSVALARSGAVRVSYLSTPGNLRRLPPPPSDLPPGVLEMVPLEFPETPRDGEGNVLEGESTLDLPFDHVQFLKAAFDLLCKPLAEFLDHSPVGFMILDFASPWACEVAHKRGIPVGLFSVFNASSFAFFGSPDDLVGESKRRLRSSPEGLTSPPPWLGFSSLVAYRPHEAPWVLAGFYGENASGTSDARRLADMLMCCDFVAIRSCYEFEGPYLDVVRKLMGKPVIPLGLLPPNASMDQPKQDSDRDLLDWLNERKEKSVVFVAFGTESRISKEQVQEIARGLELSKIPFLWVLSKPVWATAAASVNEILPGGFSQRTSSVGRVHIGWVTQGLVLAHPSIGGCLFHSGWSSIVEMLRFGHRLVAMPLVIDQPLLAKLLVEKGLAVEVEVRDKDGSYTGEAIAGALKEAMESEIIGARAWEHANIFADMELHQGYLAKFIDYLKTYHNKVEK
ncbi:hypothetical protein MLD38_036368 [Melastoma candidum]|uniref:Uncharacterized protein n=1 Tax=Melastoma candidum TaxID=119954 RepID=A0ACB9LJF6_9MYRT|nr:hypothetical protein MLD38_036368 [Melastoma candidum]